MFHDLFYVLELMLFRIFMLFGFDSFILNKYHFSFDYFD